MAAFNPFLSDYGTSAGLNSYTDRYTHFFGGDNYNADPMIKGFGVVAFTKLPSILSDSVAKGKLLTALCTNVSIPSISLESETYEGRDGGKWVVPTKVNVSQQQVSLSFWELVGIPIYKTLGQWVSVMRNAHYGYMTDVNWKQSEYKGKMMYISCTPDLKVQFTQVFTGIWPIDLESANFGGNITEQSKVEFNCNFSFDHYPYQSSEIDSVATTFIASMQDEIDVVVRQRYSDSAATPNL